jgi:outer membrane lipoprotein-sorting protein
MLRQTVGVGIFTVLAMSFAVGADAPAASAKLSATEIVERNIAARGGLQAWHSVQTMSWTGKMDAGGGSVERSRRVAEGRRGHVSKLGLPDSKDAGKGDQQVQLPFVMEMKRPGKSRIEVEFAGKTAVQVYDGTNGWKVRPFLNRKEVEVFTADELKSEQGKDLDGPLVDYAAKGTTVEVEGIEPVEGHDAYKLKLTTKSGAVQHVWIDKQSFLDVKVEGSPRRMDGKMRTVWVYQREFRSVQGVLIPFLLETAVDGYHETHKMIIEKAVVNPKLDDNLFAKPKA